VDIDFVIVVPSATPGKTGSPFIWAVTERDKVADRRKGIAKRGSVLLI
jgi:hypothetical protein